MHIHCLCCQDQYFQISINMLICSLCLCLCCLDQRYFRIVINTLTFSQFPSSLNPSHLLHLWPHQSSTNTLILCALYQHFLSPSFQSQFQFTAFVTQSFLSFTKNQFTLPIHNSFLPQVPHQHLCQSQFQLVHNNPHRQVQVHKTQTFIKSHKKSHKFQCPLNRH